MNYLISQFNDPTINLATEEYLLKNFGADFFFLYINSPVLVVGKHQNTLAEINFDRVHEEGIPVIRRLSGGGTVFHDLGNLNYCFIVHGEKGKLVDFRKHSWPIIACLQSLGVNAQFEGKSDLTINGKKFSGNASHVYKNKVMQHGTMLFSSDLKRLNQLLKVNPLKFKDRGVRSIRSHVTNIVDYLPNSMTIEEFSREVLKKTVEIYPFSNEFYLNDDDLLEIKQISKEKYQSWEWNYGYSPNYLFEKVCNYSEGKILEIKLKIEKGLIRAIQFEGNCIIKEDITIFYDKFLNIPHTKESINMIFNSLNLDLYFKNLSEKELIQLFF